MSTIAVLIVMFGLAGGCLYFAHVTYEAIKFLMRRSHDR